MTMTKSRRAAKAVPAENGWESLAIAVDRDFDKFVLKICEGERHSATIYRQNYANNRVCSYDQATHSMFLDLIGQEAACTELLRRFVVLQSERIDRLERDLKKAKGLHTKAFDDLQVEQIDDRRIRLALGRGEDEASFELAFPMLIDRGAWSERASYDRGDAVTSGGGFWVAQVDNPTGKPGSPDSGWRLAVKSARGAEQRR